MNINQLEVFFMFMVFSKEKIFSYLISLSTVVLLFVISFAITKKNDEILKTSANAVKTNEIQNELNIKNNSNEVKNVNANIINNTI